jgi:Protein of unknown function (DUF3570)
MVRVKKGTQNDNLSAALSALTAATLVLPGLVPTPAQAAEGDTVDFQYSHYQEGKRDIYGFDNPIYAKGILTKLPQNLNPIEVESIHGSGRFNLTDRINFSFNYTQDTWSGATPIATAPAVSGSYGVNGKFDNDFNIIQLSGASPLLGASAGKRPVFFDKNLNAYRSIYKPSDGSFSSGALNNQLTHVLSYASPETRKQGDFKLSYEWNEASMDIGGGISIENDYESRFGSLGGRFDFNHKQTTINWGLSYTNSQTNALLDPDALSFFSTAEYENSLLDFDENGIPREIPLKSKVSEAEVDVTYDLLTPGVPKTGATLQGSRQDWGAQLGLTQVLSKNALLAFDLGYTRSTGYLANPYKLVFLYQLPEQFDENTPVQIDGFAFLEIRPSERNLFNWHLDYSHYVEPLDAAVNFDYSFAHDDWGINAHTFEADWVQPLGAGWTVTPRIRYYSQSAADFYTTGLFYKPKIDEAGNSILPKYYSSDQRLSGFGTLSGGLTLDKQFAKGLGLQLGFEYYTHQGGLKLGGGGEQDFADFDYWVANAALMVNLAALETASSHGGHSGHAMHHHHSNSPAGVQFDHVLPKAGDFMVGYRYMRNVQAGDFRLGDQMIGIDQARKEGCYDEECAVTPNNMTMNMHMLDLMYAPTDWLTLMLMPQWTDMDMHMTPNPDVQLDGGHGGHHSAVHEHQTGGIGDVGAYGLFKLYGDQHHQVNLALGGTAPTGDVDIVQRKTGVNPIYNNPIHYCMQLGSGTWDFKPALTYTGQADKFSWGAQANATIRLESQNKSGFAFGDIFQGTTWGGYQWTDWLGTSVRGVFTSQGEIRGRYPKIYVQGYDENGNFIPQMPYKDQHIDTFGQPENYGGSFVDLGLGINVSIPHGAFAGNTLKFEWLQPVYTNFNGYQPDRDYALNVSWSVGF